LFAQFLFFFANFDYDHIAKLNINGKEEMYYYLVLKALV